MTHVLSLIAAKSKSPLGRDDLDLAQAELEAAGLVPDAPVWLAANEAADVPVGGDPAAVLGAIRSRLAGRPVDVNAVPLAHRRKRLLVADMDSTMIGQECIDELAAELGLGEKIAAITERAMRGEIEFEPALRERVALLKGLAAETVEQILATRIALTPGGTILIATMREAGAYTALVSGGFTAFAGPIAGRIGFDEFRANELLIEAEAFTGFVAEPILGRDAKKATLVELSGRFGLTREETLAIGDGANDLAMVEAAGLGIAYRAKPALRAAADASLDHADLTGVLFLQGYYRDDFAGG